MELFFPETREPKKTLLLVRTDGIGDFVFFSRYLKSIREKYADYLIVLVCRRETAELARHNPILDSVLGFRFLAYRWNYLYRIGVLRRIRSLKPELAVYCSYHRQHIGDEMTLFSGARQTIAMSGNDECIHPSVRKRNNSIFGRIVGVEDHVHERQRYKTLLGNLGMDGIDFPNEMMIPVPEVAKGDIPPKPYIVLSPGASNRLKLWPQESYAQLAEWIHRDLNLQVVLCGDSAAKNTMNQIAAQMKQKPIVMSSWPLTRVAGMIKHARAFVGNDSGLLHLASSFEVPAVGIVYGGHFSRYFPYGRTRVVTNKLPCFECNSVCIYERPFCVTDVTVETVMEEVRAVLGDPSRARRP